MGGVTVTLATIVDQVVAVVVQVLPAVPGRAAREVAAADSEVTGLTDATANVSAALSRGSGSGRRPGRGGAPSTIHLTARSRRRVETGVYGGQAGRWCAGGPHRQVLGPYFGGPGFFVAGGPVVVGNVPDVVEGSGTHAAVSDGRALQSYTVKGK